MSPERSAPRLSDRALSSTLLSISTALEAGMGLERIVGDPGLQATFPAGFALKISEGLRRGMPAADAFETTGFFRQHELALIAAGERSGNLAQVLAQLSETIEQRVKDRRAVLSGLAYPSFLVIAASLILPLPLLVTCGAGKYLAAAIWVPLAVVAAWVVFGFWLPSFPAPDPRRTLPRRAVRILPVVSSIVRRVDTGVFFEVWGSAIRAGLSITDGLQTAHAAVEDPGLRRMATQARVAVLSGSGLTEALSKAGVLRPEVLGLVSQGELTGTLEATTARIAEMEKEAGRRMTKRAMTFLVVAVYGAVVLIVARSIIVGFMGLLDTIDAATNF